MEDLNNRSKNKLRSSSVINKERRNFLKSMIAVSGGLAFSPIRVMAGPFSEEDYQNLVPIDKKLNSDWVESLYARGTPTIYKGEELKYIGMPVGGIFTGQLYLGGDGRLWRWDIFNHSQGTGAAHYAVPPNPEFPVEQGFELQIGDNRYSLDKDGFSEVSFKGQYPIGEVLYKDSEIPVEVKMEAYSPFMPLNSDDSGLPATIMEFTLTNNSNATQELTLMGTLENAVCLYNRHVSGKRTNKLVNGEGFSFLDYSAEKEEVVEEPRSEILFEDWNRADYEGWSVNGTAFGSAPIRKSDIPSYQGDVGGDTMNLVNSHATAPGGSVTEKDGATGKLTSSKFTISRKYINLWIGGGSHAGKTCVNLLVDNELVLSLTGKNNNQMQLRSFFVKDFEGKEAYLEIVDNYSGAWGNVGVGKISFSDVEAESVDFDQLPDYGTMGLGLLGDENNFFENENSSALLSQKLTGKIGRKLSLSGGESKTISFVLAWSFPNISNGSIGNGRYYANRFNSAQGVASYVAANYERLSRMTKLWRDTWYDSTLPFWFLDRTFLNVSTAATSTCYRYENGRMWAWEGVGCCAGTCTHVWHYAQALARIFPDIERDVRERVDLGVALNVSSGVSGFRAENHQAFAVDGQAGTILRIYREHQMTANNDFLVRNWESIKLMFRPLFSLDPDGDGILEGGQMNTLDRPWYGKISWLSSIYLAALRAGEAMALEMGENEFAGKCKQIIENGKKNIDEQLFNGEYYYQIGHSGSMNQVGSYDGCEIDQVLGQSWIFQIGLDRVLPKENTLKALESLWKYNFAIDAGAYRNAQNAGRVYAMEGEAGLLMCSWPKGDSKRIKESYDYYFNECMTGFEYQVAGHMIWEGMLEKGLAITRAIHDRYHAIKRNPWNEVGCGDHYARAMASYGVYIAASGFTYHGPKEEIGFSPKLNPENFKAAFTTAEGWGAFSQKLEDKKLTSSVEIKYGSVKVRAINLGIPENIDPKSLKVELLVKQQVIHHKYSISNNQLEIIVSGPSVLLDVQNSLEVKVLFETLTSNVELFEKNKLDVYPIPSRGDINFRFYKIPVKLEIVDLNGKLCFSQNINQNTFEHSFSNLNKGLYTATAVYDDSRISQRIIFV